MKKKNFLDENKQRSAARMLYDFRPRNEIYGDEKKKINRISKSYRRRSTRRSENNNDMRNPTISFHASHSTLPQELDNECVATREIDIKLFMLRVNLTRQPTLSSFFFYECAPADNISEKCHNTAGESESGEDLYLLCNSQFRERKSLQPSPASNFLSNRKAGLNSLPFLKASYEAAAHSKNINENIFQSFKRLLFSPCRNSMRWCGVLGNNDFQKIKNQLKLLYRYLPNIQIHSAYHRSVGGGHLMDSMLLVIA